MRKFLFFFFFCLVKFDINVSVGICFKKSNWFYGKSNFHFVGWVQFFENARKYLRNANLFLCEQRTCLSDFVRMSIQRVNATSGVASNFYLTFLYLLAFRYLGAPSATCSGTFFDTLVYHVWHLMINFRYFWPFCPVSIVLPAKMGFTSQ